MKVINIVWCIVCMFLTTVTNVSAIVDPLSTPNNKYGIHIVDENDLDDAVSLVNSNGGEWGYITMVITENDRNTEKWQKIFDLMRRNKVIPVVRIATSPQGNVWKKPIEEDAVKWADFLSNLNWVIKNRYIILFNEPNHAKEWGGELNPQEYAKISRIFYTKLKERSSDFFILPAGFDQASSNSSDTMDIVQYFKWMYANDNEIFKIFDGWTVHAYPNPNFSGSPLDNGRASIRGYVWEIETLKQFGFTSTKPIFITETGWAHQEGKGPFLSSDIVGSFYQDAYQNAWNDNRIVMVSPFIFNYQAAPFIQFSWKKPNSGEFYPQYHLVKAISKNKGTPVQNDSAELLLDSLPPKLTLDSLFFLPVKIKNTGQKIWDTNTNFTLKVAGATSENQIIKITVDNVEPLQEKIVKIAIKTPDTEGIIPLVFSLSRDDVQIEKDRVFQITVTEPPSLWGKTVLFIKRMSGRKRN